MTRYLNNPHLMSFLSFLIVFMIVILSCHSSGHSQRPSSSEVTADTTRQKLVAEMADERGRLEKWSAAGEPLWEAVLKKIILELKEGETELRQLYEVRGELRWKQTSEVAKAAKLQVELVRDYFVGSKHVHATVSALVDREAGCLYVIEALHRLIATVCRAAELTNEFFCVTPFTFEDASKVETQSENFFGQVEKQLKEHISVQ